MKILIADDHPVIREGLKEIIESDGGMTVMAQARDADQAVELARRLAWDVAVVDYSMPGRGGADLVREIKRCHPARPVLVLSVYPEEAQGVQALKAGASGYLNKDSAVEQLVFAILKVAAGGKYISPRLAERLAGELGHPSRDAPHESLSAWERRVMPLLASGKTIKEISDEFGVRPSTISTYRARIFRKLGVAHNSELVRYAIRHRLVSDAIPPAWGRIASSERGAEQTLPPPAR